MDAQIEDHNQIGSDGRRNMRRPAPLARASARILDRALAYLTSDLDCETAARVREDAWLSPDCAAQCGYALGYLEGGTDHAPAMLDTLPLHEDTAGALRGRLAALLEESPRK